MNDNDLRKVQGFGPRLRAARKAASKSLFDLAKHLDVTTPYVSDVERGARTPFTRENIIKAADLLGVNPAVLMEAAINTKGYAVLDQSGASPHLQLAAKLAIAWPHLDAQQLQIVNAALDEATSDEAR